ncbi:hypothetical protein JCM8097_004512 [Rhodosporidiobolus ruineniae]
MAPTTTTPSSANGPTQPVLPRDARLVALLLAAAGAEDCEEGVVRMLVEFAHRYTGDVLTDSLMYAEHARGAAAQAAAGGGGGAAAGGAGGAAQITPTLDDLRLAVQARTEGAQVPKEFLLQLSTTVNSTPLPPVPEVYGIRLPPPSQRLTAPNFSLVPRSNPELAPTGDELPLLGAGALPELSGGAGAAAGDEEGGSGGLFGDDDDDEDEDDDDEEMEDVTAGIGMGGSMSGSNGMMGGAGLKRKAGESDEEYD